MSPPRLKACLPAPVFAALRALRHSRLRIALAAGAALALVLGLFIGGAQPAAVGLIPPPWDKLAHAGVFGAIAFLLHGGLRLPGWLAVMLAVLVGAGDEIHQSFLPGRAAGLDDWLADLAGAVLAVLLVKFLRRKLWSTPA